MDVAVIGAGNFGREHLRAYSLIPEARLVAVADVDGARAEQAAFEFGGLRSYSDPSRMLTEMRPQAVSIVSTPEHHLRLTQQSIAAGAAVLLEKPVLRATAGAGELLRMSRDGVVMPGHILRFTPEYVKLKEAVGDSPVVGLFARRNRDRSHSLRFPQEHPAFLTLIHDIDQAMWIGDDRALEVSAIERSIGTHAGTNAVFARVLSVSGQVWDLHSTWLAERDQGFASRMEVHTHTHTAVAEIGANAKPSIGSLVAELTELITCVREGRRSTRISLPEAIHGIAIAQAIVRSAKSGKTINLEIADWHELD